GGGGHRVAASGTLSAKLSKAGAGAEISFAIAGALPFRPGTGQERQQGRGHCRAADGAKAGAGSQAGGGGVEEAAVSPSRLYCVCLSQCFAFYVLNFALLP